MPVPTEDIILEHGAASTTDAFRTVYAAYQSGDCTVAVAGQYFDEVRFDVDELDAMDACENPDPNFIRPALSDMSVSAGDAPADTDVEWAEEQGLDDIAKVVAYDPTSYRKFILHVVQQDGRWYLLNTGTWVF